ncbi:MAG: hypothetical protein P8Q92_06895 [Pseudoprimorskyibacter sp.]|nr:hypothetical protein [Pseudoprimorskyibacter sp.]
MNGWGVLRHPVCDVLQIKVSAMKTNTLPEKRRHVILAKIDPHHR